MGLLYNLIAMSNRDADKDAKYCNDEAGQATGDDVSQVNATPRGSHPVSIVDPTSNTPDPSKTSQQTGQIKLSNVVGLDEVKAFNDTLSTRPNDKMPQGIAGSGLPKAGGAALQKTALPTNTTDKVSLTSPALDTLCRKAKMPYNDRMGMLHVWKVMHQLQESGEGTRLVPFPEV